MPPAQRPIRLLMADDDHEDRLLAREAFQEARLANDLDFVKDGEELMDYLRHRGRYADTVTPDVVLLDLNMPRKDGREALAEIKADPALRRLPVIIMTTSAAEEDVVRSYDLGVNSYIRKPVTFDRLVDVIRTLGRYWFEIVELPPHDNRTTAK